MKTASKWGFGLLAVLFVALALSLGIGACGGDEEVTTTEVVEPAIVRFGAGPVFDAQMPFVALQLGYWDDVNIQAEVRTAQELAQGTQAMTAGSLEFAFQSLDVTIPQARTIDTMAWARIDDLWYGLQFVAREGDFKTYEDFVAEGLDQAAAVKATVEQLRGKTLITFYTQWQSSLNGLTELLGLGPADEFFKIHDMAFQEGAVAFIRGEGDAYMGDLPGTFRAIEEGGVSLTSNSQWPAYPGSYVYVGWVANKSWLDTNEDTFMRVMGVLFRVADDLSPRTLEPNERQDAVLQIMLDNINKESGSTFDLATARWVNKEISPWLTVDEMGEVLFGPDSFQNVPNMVAALSEVKTAEGVEIDAAAVDGLMSYLEPLYDKYIGYRDAAKADIEKAKASDNKDVQELVTEAQAQYDIFNYIDAARLAAQAVETM